MRFDLTDNKSHTLLIKKTNELKFACLILSDRNKCSFQMSVRFDLTDNKPHPVLIKKTKELKVSCLTLSDTATETSVLSNCPCKD